MVTYLYHAPTQKLHFQYEIKKKKQRYFTKCARFLRLLLATAMTFQIPFFFFTMDFYTGFILKWQVYVISFL